MSTTKISLEPLDNLSKYLNTEPEMLQIRESNKRIIHLDAQANTFEDDKTNMILSTQSAINQSENALFQYIRRCQVINSGINYITPNVNPRNNQIDFISSNTGAVVHTILLDEGFYTTSLSLINHIITKLNALTGVTGLTFSQALNIPGSNQYVLSSAGGTYYIVNTCNAVVKGQQLYNLPTTQTLAASHLVGTMSLFYTRYIDVTSRALNKHSKVKMRNNNNLTDIVIRIFVDDPTREHFISNFSNSDIINWEASESVYEIDFRLFDQFGEPLYVPPGEGGFYSNENAFVWDVQMSVG